MYMSSKSGSSYRVPRTATKHGDSVMVTLPIRELRRLGIDPETLVGENLVADVTEDRVAFELP